VEEGKETKEINGKKYLLELPLHADVALIKCHTADRFGNGTFKYTAENFNPLMAMAADTVILECENLVETGEIEPDQVRLPGIFVDYVVPCEEVRI
jgi:acetate CoA/acetoacetate CoA-transferase alpha subunit